MRITSYVAHANVERTSEERWETDRVFSEKFIGGVEWRYIQ